MQEFCATGSSNAEAFTQTGRVMGCQLTRAGLRRVVHQRAGRLRHGEPLPAAQHGDVCQQQADPVRRRDAGRAAPIVQQDRLRGAAAMMAWL